MNEIGNFHIKSRLGLYLQETRPSQLKSSLGEEENNMARFNLSCSKLLARDKGLVTNRPRKTYSQFQSVRVNTQITGNYRCKNNPMDSSYISIHTSRCQRKQHGSCASNNWESNKKKPIKIQSMFSNADQNKNQVFYKLPKIYESYLDPSGIELCQELNEKLTLNSKLLGDLRTMATSKKNRSIMAIEESQIAGGSLFVVNHQIQTENLTEKQLSPQRRLKMKIEIDTCLKIKNFSAKLTLDKSQIIKKNGTLHFGDETENYTGGKLGRHFQRLNYKIGYLDDDCKIQKTHSRYKSGNRKAPQVRSLKKSLRSTRNQTLLYPDKYLTEKLTAINTSSSTISRKSAEFISEPKITDFFIQKKLGEGQFGKVSLAIHKQTGTIYALKQISKQKLRENSMIDQLIVEIKIQSFLNHRNMLKMFGSFSDKDNIFLILEYMESGNLFQLLQKKKTLTESEARKYLRQITQGLQHLHDNGIAHRDMKPENIVMSNVNHLFMKNSCKICDFGWSAICKNRRNTYCGTFDYAAPQILQGDDYDISIDLWGLGVLAYELMAGKPPFYHYNRQQTIKNIINVKQNQLSYPQGFSKEAKSFISGLLKKNPEQRFDVSAALNHSFLRQKR